MQAVVPRVQRRERVNVAVDAAAAQVEKLSFDGSKNGTAELDLKIARNEVAKGLVHKYVVMVRQNARRVSLSLRLP